MDEVFLLSRLMFAFLVVGSGVGHLMQTDNMVAYAQMRGISNPKPMVQISGIAMIAGGVSIALGIFGDIGALGLAVLLVIVALMMHAFWKETDQIAKMTEMVQFNKNIALAGGALAIFVLLALPGDTPYTITDALIDWY